MTVKELIALLATMPQEKNVISCTTGESILGQDTIIDSSVDDVVEDDDTVNLIGVVVAEYRSV